MLHEALFILLYLGLLPTVRVSPFAGVLVYHWLDYLPPNDVYAATVVPDNISFITGALTFLVWMMREPKALPRPVWIVLLMGLLLIWINFTWQYALVPDAGEFFWIRTIKVIGFVILTTLMLSSRARLEAFVWTFVLAVAYYAVPSAIKVLVSGGSGGIGTGDVVAADAGFFGYRVILSVVMAMALPYVLYLRTYSALAAPAWLRTYRFVMVGIFASLLIASVGTFARTAVFASGAALLMIVLRARRKVIASVVIALTVIGLFSITPENWFARMTTITEYQNDDSAMSRITTWKWAWAMTLDHPIVGGGFGVFTLNAGSIQGRSGWNEAHNIFFEMMAEHGFVGLVLFCLLILVSYRSCGTVQRRTRHDLGLYWIGDLARATQVALVALVAGGCFVSIASNPFLYLLAGVAAGTRSLMERELFIPRISANSLPVVEGSTVPRTA